MYAPPLKEAAHKATKNRGTIVITGTSTGIGRAAATWLADAGFRVFAGARKLSDAPEDQTSRH